MKMKNIFELLAGLLNLLDGCRREVLNLKGVGKEEKSECVSLLKYLTAVISRKETTCHA